jgi:hypothetical protein
MYSQTSTTPAASTEGWQFQLTPYLWGAGFKGSVGINEHVAEADASFRDIFDELNFGFMGLFEARRDRFVTFTDLVYTNLSDEKATRGFLVSNVDAAWKSFILAPQVGYRIAGSEAAYVDALGGIRFWHVNGQLNFEGGALAALDVEGNRNWVDGIFGVRGKLNLSPAWYIRGYGDIGGGGSNLTYQLLGVAGASVGEHVAVVFGYRYLDVNYNKDRFLYDTQMQGPVAGLAFKF